MKKAIELSLFAGLVLTLYAASPRAGARTENEAAVQSIGAATGAASPSTQPPTLDYEFFKSRVEPIFLKKRPTHARC